MYMLHACNSIWVLEYPCINAPETGNARICDDRKSRTIIYSYLILGNTVYLHKTLTSLQKVKKACLLGLRSTDYLDGTQFWGKKSIASRADSIEKGETFHLDLPRDLKSQNSSVSTNHSLVPLDKLQLWGFPYPRTGQRRTNTAMEQRTYSET